MSKKSSLFAKNLNNRPVYIEDPYNNSPYYFNIISIPNKLSLGKNSIRISPNPNMLDLEQPIEFEFVDSYGNVLYYEIPKYSQENDLNLRLISLYIYNTVAPGPIYMTIIGTAKINLSGQPVPSEWANIQNIRYNKQLHFENSSKNESEILYDISPICNMAELRRPYYNRDLTISSSFSVITGSGYYYNQQNTPIIELIDSEFTTDMIGGTIIIQGNDLYPVTDQFTLNSYTSHTSNIKYLISNKLAVLTSKYTASINELQGGGTVYFDKTLTLSPVQVNYYITPELSTTQNYKSYLYVDFKNFEPVSGIVKKVLINGRSKGGSSEYELIGETEVKNVELLINTSSLYDYDRRNVGYFLTSSAFNSFWITSSINVTYDVQSLYNSVYLEPSDINNYFKSKVDISYQKGSSYELFLNYKTLPNSIIDVYMSGSAFSSYDSLNGKLLYSINSNTNGISNNNFLIEYSADQNGIGNLNFVVRSGKCYLSDISIKCMNEVGFTPSNFTAYIPINVKSRNDVYDFKVELLDDLGRTSPLFFESSSVLISGSNFYLQESDNLVTGSLFVGTGISNGLELIGNSSMLRTANYNGGEGFAFWSGSQYVSGSLTSGSGIFIETGPPMYHYIKATAGSGIEIAANISGSAVPGGVTESTFLAFSSSISNELTVVSQSISSSFTPEFFQSLFNIPCGIGDSSDYILLINCNNGVVSFKAVSSGSGG